LINPHTELRFVDPLIGWGVFATALIPRGTITWVFDDLDQIVAPEKVQSLAPLLAEAVEKYSYLNGRDERILCWDHSRFINHSCRATCLSPGFDFEIAVRDIQAGEELTDDYGTLNLEAPFPCSCGAPECRGTIGREDFETCGAAWDESVHAAFRLINQVPQPLWKLVRERPAVELTLAGERPIPSCRVHDLGVQVDGRRTPTAG
jgi:hypothetical protein